MRILPFHRIYEVYDGGIVRGKIERQEDEWIFLPFDGFVPTDMEPIQSKIRELNERDNFRWSHLNVRLQDCVAGL